MHYAKLGWNWHMVLEKVKILNNLKDEHRQKDANIICISVEIGIKLFILETLKLA